jgi:copper chaperone CopZ
MKTLTIEWKHLDVEGKTCDRCSNTGEALQEVIGEITEECELSGWAIKFKETKLTSKNISESNILLFNGKPIEAILPEARASESHCESCSKITGKSTSCRTVEFGGNSYGGIPESLIRQAVCQITQCD